MECNQSTRGQWAWALLIVTVGCARVGPIGGLPLDEEAATETAAAGTAKIDDADSQVTLASAAVGDVTASDERPEAALVDDGVSLRDANIATDLIARFFPIQDMFLKYSGALSSPYRDSTGHVPAPEASQWVLDRVEWDGTQRSEVVFELLSAPKSEHDIPLHVELDRVVYVHVLYCRDGELGIVPNEQFKIDSIGILDLFRECDVRATQHWQMEQRFAEAMIDVLEDDKAVYDRHGHRVSPPKRWSMDAVRPPWAADPSTP